MPETVKTYTKKDFTSDQAVRWCPGCGDYAILAQTQKVFPDLINKPDIIQVVLVNMCFNLGAPRLSKFRKFIAAINDEQWIEASVEMMDSRWANQVGPRAERLKEIVLSQAN